ncbi:TraB/GumN family protein [Erysipelothrix sp. D19-032]
MDEHLPDVSLRLLHERNYYMAEKIKAVYGDTLVVVIGAAHTEGIIEALYETHSLSELNVVPPKKKKFLGSMACSRNLDSTCDTAYF